MKLAVVTGAGTTDVIDVAQPEVGPRDVLVKIRACGICGSDALYIAIGGLPPHHGRMPLGHEPAGEIVAVGAEVADLAVGDHVVIDPMATPGDIIGNGGGRGALAEYLLLTDAVRGTHLEVIPDHIPFEVAALNEPMAVARHAVNRGFQLAAASGAHYTVLHALHLGPLHALRGLLGDRSAQVVRRLEAEAREALAGQLADSSHHHGVAASQQVQGGPPADVISASADAADADRAVAGPHQLVRAGREQEADIGLRGAARAARGQAVGHLGGKLGADGLAQALQRLDILGL